MKKKKSKSSSTSSLVYSKLYQQFKKSINGKKSILIVMHNFPDPDSIMSAFLFFKLARFLKLKTKIVYGGEIIFEENRFMIELLKMKVSPYVSEEEKKYDLVALVDHQQEMKNCPLSSNLNINIVIDHHPKIINKTTQKKTANKQKFFSWIDEKSGTCCSMILVFLVQEEKIKLDKNAIAGYCYTVDTETSFFQRKYSSLDEELYKKYFSVVDLKKLNQLRHLEKDPKYYNLIEYAIKNYQIKNEVLYCCLGEKSSKQDIVEIAEFFIRKKTIHTTFVTGILNNKTYFSSRNKDKKFHLGNFLNQIKGIDAGGHQEMAAGSTEKKEKEVVKLIQKSFKNL